jgi:hypothetical protein
MPDEYRFHSQESRRRDKGVDTAKPWSRRADESERAYAAFCLYRDSEKRALTHVARTLNCSVANVSRWSTRYQWHQRAWAFDSDIEERKLEQMAKDRIAMRQRHIKLGLELQALAATAVSELQEKISRGEALNLKPDEIVALMKLGAELEAKALGPERENGYARIIVNFCHRYDDEADTPNDESEPPSVQ